MKKYLLVFIVLALVGLVYFGLQTGYFKSTAITPDPRFVSINERGFQLDGKDFYPVVMNYMVSMQTDGKLLWPASYKGYGQNSYFNHASHDSSMAEFQAEMEMIREMGFNAVRIVGIGEKRIDDKQTGLMSVMAHFGNEKDTLFSLADSNNYNNYIGAIEKVFEACKKADLKVIFLSRMFDEIPATSEYLKRLLIHFKDEPTVMAFDLFNEPLYFDSLARDKRDVYYITQKWQKIMRKYSPHHLSTIGLAGIREVFEWDPNLMNVDFISIHPYEYEPEQVRNEMYWYYKTIRILWLIGETFIAADNDSVPYENQKIFAAKTMKQAYDCNAVGYSWWQYKDVEWFEFHSNFMGVMNREGSTVTQKGKIITGTPKSTIEAFREFNPKVKKDSCLCLPNYYNYTEGTTFRLTGSLVDKKGYPVEGGVILAWNEHWSSSYHTVTKADGSFELMSTFPLYHWMASASLYSMVRGDINPADAKTGADGIPTYDIGRLQVKMLKESAVKL